MKRKLNYIIVLSLAAIMALLYAGYNIRWQDAYLMTDGCACGREREYIAIGRTQYNMVIKKQGNPKHRHNYWDPTWIKNWMINIREQRQLTPYKGTDGKWR